MFWSKKTKKTKSLQKSGKSQKSVSPSDKSEQIRAEAMAKVRAARESIGEETLDRIAAAMTKKQQSATERAKAQIQSADAERVANEILAMIDEKD